MDEFSVVIYDDSHFEVWNDFIANAKNASFLFHRNFMEYHRDRFEDYSLLIYKKGVLICVVPAAIERGIVKSHAGLTYGGLVCKSDIRMHDTLAVFQSVLHFLEQRKIEYMEIKVIPVIYNRYFSDELEYMAFLTEATLIRRDITSVIDLKNPLGFGKNRKAQIRKAIKNDLRVEETADFTDFWKEILIPNLWSRHQKKPVHSLEEIQLLKNYFPEQIRQFNVYSDRIIGGVTVFETDTTVHLQYISGTESHNHLGGLDFLHAYLIEEVFVDKDFFDLGISNEQGGRKLNSGLLLWKEGFGARAVVHNFYSIETKNHLKLKEVWI